MRIYELAPVGSVKSFYGKAIVVVDDDGSETLKSYQTDIIRRDADGSLPSSLGWLVGNNWTTHLRLLWLS